MLAARISSLLVVLGSLVVLDLSARAQTPPQASTPTMPSAEALVIFIRSSLLALAHANETGNYTVVRDLAAPSFHAANTAARLSGVFLSLRESGLDLQIAALVTPQLSQSPVITPQSLLAVTGFLPTSPAQIDFQLVYQPVNGRWRLFSIVVQQGAPKLPAPTVAAPGKSAPATAKAVKPATPRGAPVKAE